MTLSESKLPKSLSDPLLQRIPYVEDDFPTESIQLSGVAVQCDPGKVRIIQGNICLSFDARDVLDAREVSREDPALPAIFTLTLRRPARLLYLEPVESVIALSVETPKPFAFAVRPNLITAPPNPTFRDQEARFLRDFAG
jgi:hypothetical protein